MTTGSPPSRTETTELVVPRSIPTALGMGLLLRVFGGSRGGSGATVGYRLSARCARSAAWSHQSGKLSHRSAINLACRLGAGIPANRRGDCADSAPCAIDVCLVLVRHGRVEWNEKNLFTGWYDADLTDEGAAEAAARRPATWPRPASSPTSSTPRCRPGPSAPPSSPSTRSTGSGSRSGGRGGSTSATTAPSRASTRPRPRSEYGAEQFKIWRRSYDVPPPPLDPDDERHARFDPRYASLPADLIPASRVPEGRRRADAAVVVRRHRPRPARRAPPCWWPPTATASAALVKHLEGISDDDITELNIPTGVPFVYDLDDDFRPASTAGGSPPGPRARRAVGDVDAARASAAAVAAQGRPCRHRCIRKAELEVGSGRRRAAGEEGVGGDEGAEPEEPGDGPALEAADVDQRHHDSRQRSRRR